MTCARVGSAGAGLVGGVKAGYYTGAVGDSVICAF